jgi:ABC-2 type transport system permease protein
MRTRQLAAPAEIGGRQSWADRSGLVVSATFYLIVSTILGALWRAAAGGHGTVAGYSGRELTWYVFASEAAVCALDFRLIDVIGEEIAAGDVAVEMLRPVPAVAVRMAVEGGRSLARLAVLAALGAVLAWLTVGPPPSVSGAALAIPSLALAVATNLAMQHAVSAAAFWLRDNRATWFLYQKFVFILGGMLLPLEVLPPVLHAVSAALPFMAVAYVPARQAGGHPAPVLLAAQAGWLVLMVGAAVAAFAAGQRRLQAVGG